MKLNEPPALAERERLCADALAHFGFTVENVAVRAKRLLG